MVRYLIKMVQIEYIEWGLANRFSDRIELNENLKKYPKLHAAILEHELGHHNSNSFRQDFAHDLAPMNKLSQADLLKFMFKHPKTWTQFAPFYWSPRRKDFIIDYNMTIIYGVGIVIFLLLWFLI